MNQVEKLNHAVYYPFTYLVKWDNINKMIFGEKLRNKIHALFKATEKKTDISLVKEQISTSFNIIFFAVQSGPKLSPFEVLEIVKNNVAKKVNDLKNTKNCDPDDSFTDEQFYSRKYIDIAWKGIAHEPRSCVN